MLTPACVATWPIFMSAPCPCLRRIGSGPWSRVKTIHLPMAATHKEDRERDQDRHERDADRRHQHHPTAHHASHPAHAAAVRAGLLRPDAWRDRKYDGV